MKEKINIGDVLERFEQSNLYASYQGFLYENVRSHWKILRLDEVQKSIRKHLTEVENRAFSSSQVKEMERRMMTDERFEFCEEEVEHPRKMNLQNGVLDLTTEELVKNCPENFLYRLNFSYQEKPDINKAPEFKKFLESSLGDAKKAELFLECLGYCVSDTFEAQKAIFFYGESGTGKSVILNLVKRIVGEENVTGILLNDVGERFNKARLAGSRINVCSEMNGGKFKNEAIFKSIVSNERIMAENKGESPFEFRVRTKLLTAGNVFPEFTAGAGMEAILRRIVVVRFTQRIAEKDLHLEEKLWEERDVIFSLATKALIRLKINDFQFTQVPDSEKMFEVLKQNATAFEDFVEAECVFGETQKIHISTLWEKFQNFLEENGYDIMKLSKADFSQKVMAFEGVKRERFRVEGKSLWGFKGIGLREEQIEKNQSKILRRYHAKNATQISGRSGKIPTGNM